MGLAILTFVGVHVSSFRKHLQYPEHSAVHDVTKGLLYRPCWRESRLLGGLELLPFQVIQIPVNNLLILKSDETFNLLHAAWTYEYSWWR